MLIFKIFRSDEWAHLRANGETQGAPIDIADGYVHFSTAEQAQETADKHFAGVEDLFLLGVETDPLGDDLKWEVSRGDALFSAPIPQLETRRCGMGTAFATSR